MEFSACGYMTFRREDVIAFRYFGRVTLRRLKIVYAELCSLFKVSPISIKYGVAAKHLSVKNVPTEKFCSNYVERILTKIIIHYLKHWDIFLFIVNFFIVFLDVLFYMLSYKVCRTNWCTSSTLYSSCQVHLIHSDQNDYLKFVLSITESKQVFFHFRFFACCRAHRKILPILTKREINASVSVDGLWGKKRKTE